MCGKAPMSSGLIQQVSWTHTMAGNAMLAVLMDRRKERFTRDLLAGKVFESVRALC